MLAQRRDKQTSQYFLICFVFPRVSYSLRNIRKNYFIFFSFVTSHRTKPLLSPLYIYPNILPFSSKTLCLSIIKISGEVPRVLPATGKSLVLVPLAFNSCGPTVRKQAVFIIHLYLVPEAGEVTLMSTWVLTVSTLEKFQANPTSARAISAN